MRVALLIPGEPRFCKEFDQFLENLQGYDQVDWFVWLWQESQCEEHRGVDVVAPSWRQLDHNTTRARIQQHLPVQHQLINLTIARKELYPAPQFYRKDGSTSVERVWGMYTSLQQCDLTRRAHEQTLDSPYDLVIRTRPDLGLTAPLDLNVCRNYLKQNPSTIITPRNAVHGYNHKTNDMMAVGPSDIMSTYCNLVDHVIEYHDRLGMIYHPETMLAFHMHMQGIKNHNSTFDIMLRKFGTVINNAYRSDYGRWA